MNLQKKYELEVAEKDGEDLKDIKPYQPTKHKSPPRSELNF
jgi:plasmid maintenance system antidote protein VapI